MFAALKHSIGALISKGKDKEGKDACWQLLKTSKKFRRLLEGHIQTGRLAEENLRRIEESRLARLGRAIRRAA